MLTTVLENVGGSWVVEIESGDVVLRVPLAEAEGMALTILSLVEEAAGPANDTANRTYVPECPGCGAGSGQAHSPLCEVRG